MRKLLIFALLFAGLAGSVFAQNPPGGGSSPAAGGALPPNTGSLPSSSLLPGFNVRNYGAKGDTQLVANATFAANVPIAGQTTVTCNNCTFTAADANNGKKIWSYTNAGVKQLDQGNIVTFTDSHHVVTDQVAVAAGPGAVGWGTDDTTAIAAAAAAALAAAKGVLSVGNTGVFTASPVLYFPSGGYIACSMANGLIAPSSLPGFVVQGDGMDSSILYSCGAPTLPGSFTTGSLMNYSNCNSCIIRNISLNGSGVSSGPQSSAYAQSGGNVFMEHVRVVQWNPSQGQFGVGIYVGSGQLHTYDVSTIGNGSGIQINHGSLTAVDSGGSNNTGSNIAFLNTTDSGAPFASGQRLTHFFNDECGTGAPTVGGKKVCWYQQNANDVFCDGCSLYGAPSQAAVGVDVNSVLYLNGGEVGPFTGDTNSSGIINRGRVQATNVRVYATGTGNPLDNTTGFFENIGGNHFGIETPISSAADAAGTCTVTTTVPHGATAAQVGQQIHVINPNVAGYGGMFPITAVPTNSTVSYACAAGLGAAGAAGHIQIDGIGLIGNIPIAAVTHGTVNWFFPTDTAQTWATWTPDQDIVITRAQVQSSNTPACTVAPNLQLTNGTTTLNVPLALGSAATDSGVISSVFTTGLPITVAMSTAGTCTTAPVNLNITIVWSGNMHP